MKRKLLTIFLLILFLFINSTISTSASSITYLYLDAIKIDNSNIEILSDEISIDTTTSKIENTLNVKNTSDKEIEMNLVFPLENEELNIFIKNLVIKLNDVQVEYEKDDSGQYIVKTRISANSGKKINVEYYTENDLQKARLIKCNFDNFTGRKIGKLKVDIKIDDKNIPLVEKIYPGHYTFDNNTISVEYYNYEVNTITKDIIVKKETFNNLLYGREVNLDDDERDIVSTWYKTGNIEIKENYETENTIVQNIIDYKKIKSGMSFSYNEEPSEPLLYTMSANIYIDYAGEKNEPELKGKNICIDYVETEGDKELYVEKVKDIQYSEDEGTIIEYELVKTDERTILQTKGTNTAYEGKKGAKIIFVGQGIDGESLNATEQEKISYVNQINADMYIRIEIYDGEVKESDDDIERRGKYSGWVGYYDDNNLEIARTFTVPELGIEEKNWNGQYQRYQTYEDYVKNYKNDYCENVLVKLDNEDISNKCEVPTVVQFIGNRETKDGKYVVNYSSYGFYDSSRGLCSTNAVLQTSQAKKMLSSNKQKNTNTKTEIEAQITNLSIVDDEEKIQQDIKNEMEKTKQQEELEKAQTEEEQVEESETQAELTNEHIFVFLCIGLGIIFCIIIIIVENKKKNKIKRGNNNGRKETN